MPPIIGKAPVACPKRAGQRSVTTFLTALKQFLTIPAKAAARGRVTVARPRHTGFPGNGLAREREKRHPGLG